MNHVLQSHNFPTHKTEEYRYMVGNGIGKLILRALPDEYKKKRMIKKLFQEFILYYQEHRYDHTQVYPGVFSLLQNMQQRGILLAIASNKIQDAIQPLVERYFQGIEFAAIHGNREGIPPKPAPDIIYNILNETGISSKETVYVGDTAVDMQTATAAQLLKIGVTWGFRSRQELEESKADFIATTADEILNFIQ
jgi:phosphoglycolate phosphatase